MGAAGQRRAGRRAISAISRWAASARRGSAWAMALSSSMGSRTRAMAAGQPAAASALQAELDMLRLAEDEETRRILYMLSDQVAAAGEDLLRNSRLMVELDVLFAKAKTSAALHGEAVELTCERRLDLRGARHPLLPSETCVPLDIALTGDQRGIIITGPNTGGKTVVLKTVGLFLPDGAMRAACALRGGKRPALGGRGLLRHWRQPEPDAESIHLFGAPDPRHGGAEQRQPGQSGVAG